LWHQKRIIGIAFDTVDDIGDIARYQGVSVQGQSTGGKATTVARNTLGIHDGHDFGIVAHCNGVATTRRKWVEVLLIVIVTSCK
jgi:hypothetical protein